MGGYAPLHCFACLQAAEFLGCTEVCDRIIIWMQDILHVLVDDAARMKSVESGADSSAVELHQCSARMWHYAQVLSRLSVRLFESMIWQKDLWRIPSISWRYRALLVRLSKPVLHHDVTGTDIDHCCACICLGFLSCCSVQCTSWDCAGRGMRRCAGCHDNPQHAVNQRVHTLLI